MKKRNIDLMIVEKVAAAIDYPLDELIKNRQACEILTDLFYNSPHSGRGKPGMILARAELGGALYGSLQRHEIEMRLSADPMVSSQLRETLSGEDGLGAIDALIAQCGNAARNGVPGGIGRGH